MKSYQRKTNVGQVAIALSVFACCLLLVEAGGLKHWAAELELGPERTVATPIVATVQDGLSSPWMEQVRNFELRWLARVGWSDDPAAVSVSLPKVVSPPVSDVATEVPVTATEIPLETAASPLPTPRTPVLPVVGDPPLVSKLPAALAGAHTVALAGDSMMAVGLSSTVLRLAPKYKSLTVVKAFRSGTGLARPEVFDWRTEYPAMLGGVKPDVVVVAIGANDGQGFVEDGVTYTFGSAEWQERYQQRVQAFLTMLEAGGAKVVWIGLPPMKSASFDEKIALVNRIQYAVVKASPGAVWFSTAGLIGDGDGKFRDFGKVGGQTARLRQPDGIHLSDDGAELVVAKVLPWLGEKQEAGSSK
jgi:hypothetical protein